MSAPVSSSWRLPLYGVQEKMTRRFTAVVLGSLAPCVLFGAVGVRALAQAGDAQNRATLYLVGGSILTLLAIFAAGLMRRPSGVSLGWVVILATLASAVIEPVMGVVGLIFGALWVTALYQGRKMDALTAAYAAASASSSSSDSASASSSSSSSSSASASSDSSSSS